MHPSTLDITALPCVDFHARRRLPQSPGVYFVLGVSKSVQYIGQAKNLRGRLWGHHRRAEFASIPEASIAWLVTDLVNLTAVEVACIGRFLPPLNNTPTTSPTPYRRVLIGMAPEVDALLDGLASTVVAHLGSRGSTGGGWRSAIIAAAIEQFDVAAFLATHGRDYDDTLTAAYVHPVVKVAPRAQLELWDDAA